MSKISDVLQRHWQLISVICGLIVAFIVIYSLRNALLPFLLGIIVVYLMTPAISWVEARFPHKSRWWRVPSILIVNFAIIGTFGVFAFYAFNSVVQAISTLLQDASEHWLAAMAVLQQWTTGTKQLLPEEMRGQLDLFALEAGTAIGDSIKADLRKLVVQIPSVLGAVLGLAVLPVFVFYILKDREKLSRSFYSGMPSWAALHVRNILVIIENVLGRYVRATLTLGLVVGALNLVGLLIIRAPLAPLLAVIAGVTEMIPSVGPWLGGAIASVVTLALAPEKLPLVIILIVAVQLIENSLLVPRIQSGFLGIHPAIGIVLLVVGGSVAGVWGLLLAVPLAATGIQLFRYVRQVVQEQNAQKPEAENEDGPTGA